MVNKHYIRDKMKKDCICVIFLAFCLLLFGCVLNLGGSLQKGTAKWWASNSSEESKERGVFVSYYEALPFEYEDSIFHMKLVFKEVYTEWVHWFEWKDTALKDCKFWNNSETLKDQQLIGIYDSSCALGVKDYYCYDNEQYVINDSCFTYLGLSDLLCLDHSKLYRGEWKALSNTGEKISLLYYWDCEGGRLPYFFLSRYEFIWHTTGVNAVGGEFADTIKIPISSSLYYDKQCGYDHAMHFPFGELVFIRKKQS